MTTQQKEDLQTYLNSFPNLTAEEKDILWNKMLIIDLNGQIEGAMEMRQFYVKTKEDTRKLFESIDNGKDITDYSNSGGGEVIVH